jgi:hypothetical protein
MDGADFDSAYLHIVNDKPVLKYIDRSDDLFIQRQVWDGGWEFFVKPGTQPTWEELKKYCNKE